MVLHETQTKCTLKELHGLFSVADNTCCTSVICALQTPYARCARWVFGFVSVHLPIANRVLQLINNAHIFPSQNVRCAAYEYRTWTANPFCVG